MSPQEAGFEIILADAVRQLHEALLRCAPVPAPGSYGQVVPHDAQLDFYIEHLQTLAFASLHYLDRAEVRIALTGALVAFEEWYHRRTLEERGGTLLISPHAID